MIAKSLKDLRNFESVICKDGAEWKPNEGFIYKGDLKAEAIKWVKDCEWIKSPWLCVKGQRCIACKRTMKMNNITEEDLK